MKVYFLVGSLLFSWHVAAQEWQMQRNPFLVSKEYIKQTGKHYLAPQHTYTSIELKIQGIFYKNGIKKVLLNTGENGFIYVREGETVHLDTEDLATNIKILKIDRNTIVLSINQAEAVQYEFK